MKNTNVYVKELVDALDKAVEAKASKNTSKTLIIVEGGGEKTGFVETGFTGCGMVGFEIPKKDWKLAKTLGGEKGYRAYSLGGNYYNGQFGDACSVVYGVLEEFKKKYLNNVAVQKIQVYQWVD